MARVNIFSGGELVGWFDREKAEVFQEAVWWDGSNNISVPTGTEFDHETLYRTRGGRWVLHIWSQWQGSRETYTFIDDETARRWLLANEHDAAVERYFGPIPEESEFESED